VQYCLHLSVSPIAPECSAAGEWFGLIPKAGEGA
jgi:hypothetical protein